MLPNKEIEKLIERKNKLNSEWTQVQLAFLSWKLSNTEAQEYLKHGFLRRLGTIFRCIQNSFAICPPSLATNKLSHEDQVDLGIQLQSHVSNVFGCLDNLAWVWVHEKGVKENGQDIRRNRVGIESKIVRESFDPKILNFLNEKADWLSSSKELRHALAHRIPLYIPPCYLTSEEAVKFKALDSQIWMALSKREIDEVDRLEAEKDALGTFIPVMTHSYGEKSPFIYFHNKMLSDFETITDLGTIFSLSL